MKRIKMGTIRGRHEMPVDDYFLDKVEDPSNMNEITAKVALKMIDLFAKHIGFKYGDGINTAEPTTCYRSDLALDLYVTGLTSVTAEIIAECATNGIPLTLYHYNTRNGEYVSQVIFKGRK